MTETSHDQLLGAKAIAGINMPMNQSDFTGDQITVPSTEFVSAQGECIRETSDMSGLQQRRAGTLAVEAFNSRKPPDIIAMQTAGFVPQTVNDFKT